MGIRSIQYFNDPGQGVAYANLDTGAVYLNAPKWKKLNVVQREFTLLHEEAHLVLNTRIETECDRYALIKMSGLGYEPRKVIEQFRGIVNMREKFNQNRYNYLLKLLN